jgi:hypothetical protein
VRVLLLIIGFSALIIVGILIAVFANYFSTLHDVGVSLVFVGIILLVPTIIAGSVTYYESKAEVNRYYALKQTIEESRKGGTSEIERAALTKKIADYNADLASVKYWNNTTFGIFISDKLADLPPLK